MQLSTISRSAHYLKPDTRARGRYRQLQRHNLRVHASTGDRSSSTTKEAKPEPGAALKAVWYGAEQFGKLLGSSRPKHEGSSDTSGSAEPVVELSRQEIVDSIRNDYSTNYFVSGVGNMSAYDPNCLFSDPFVSFRGVERFKQNVSNLGGLTQDVKLDVYGWEEAEDRVTTRWRFSAVLDLPWKPLLAAAGSTTHVIDLRTGRIVEHIERWDADPQKVIARLLKPTAKVPTNAWETFFLAVSDGDAKGMWFAVSPLVIKLSIPVIAASLVCKVATGLPGVGLGSLEGVSYLAFTAGCITEVVKFATAMYGGETGSGGRF